ncbi:MAG: pyruvate ferredoxin/flavodoxin oxidoreductase subunit delta [Deltaproteobacteria bacterium]|jgi:pyruvate ferredoxin oxidoreductase delta subunit|nr:Pyruvate synthase subunit PorD [bacterium HR37]GIW48028.1 MAG: pyruvate ferredoxin/flavodoxin oxidoreductase subunit delta [Deltaproteobacteria bacterium]
MIADKGSTRLETKEGWRNFRPEIKDELCVRCNICWVYCPDLAIYTEQGDFTARGKKYVLAYRVDYRYCKGCGICANECPVKAIEMVRE